MYLPKVSSVEGVWRLVVRHSSGYFHNSYHEGISNFNLTVAPDGIHRSGMVTALLHIGSIVEFRSDRGHHCMYVAHMSPPFSCVCQLTATASASGLYALTFGLLGLIPAPNVRRH